MCSLGKTKSRVHLPKEDSLFSEFLMPLMLLPWHLYEFIIVKETWVKSPRGWSCIIGAGKPVATRESERNILKKPNHSHLYAMGLPLQNQFHLKSDTSELIICWTHRLDEIEREKSLKFITQTMFLFLWHKCWNLEVPNSLIECKSTQNDFQLI